MMAAILSCGLMTMVSCTDKQDNPVEPVVPDEPVVPERVAQQLATPESQMERLGRGVVALPQSKGIFVS